MTEFHPEVKELFSLFLIILNAPNPPTNDQIEKFTALAAVCATQLTEVHPKLDIESSEPNQNIGMMLASLPGSAQYTLMRGMLAELVRTMQMIERAQKVYTSKDPTAIASMIADLLGLGPINPKID